MKRTVVLRSAVACFGILITMWYIRLYYPAISQVRQYDFGTYYFYAKALQEGYPIYRLDAQSTEQLRQRYAITDFAVGAAHSPVVFYAFGALTNVSFRSAAMTWMVVNLVLLAISIGGMLRLLRLLPIVRGSWDSALSSVVLVMFFSPAWHTLILGQLNTLLLFLFVASLYALYRERQILAGILIGLAVLIKPHFVLLVPLFVWKGMGNVVWSALATVCCLDASAALALRAAGNFDYWQVGIRGLIARYAADMSNANVSTWALLNRLANLTVNRWLMTPVFWLNATISCAVFVFLFRRIDRNLRRLNARFVLEFSLVLTGILSVFPVVHEHHYVLLLIPILFMWHTIDVIAVSTIGRVLFGSTVALLSLPYAYFDCRPFNVGIGTFINSFKLCATLGLLYALTKIVGRSAPLPGDSGGSTAG